MRWIFSIEKILFPLIDSVVIKGKLMLMIYLIMLEFWATLTKIYWCETLKFSILQYFLFLSPILSILNLLHLFYNYWNEFFCSKPNGWCFMIFSLLWFLYSSFSKLYLPDLIEGIIIFETYYDWRTQLDKISKDR